MLTVVVVILLCGGTANTIPRLFVSGGATDQWRPLLGTRSPHRSPRDVEYVGGDSSSGALSRHSEMGAMIDERLSLALRDTTGVGDHCPPVNCLRDCPLTRDPGSSVTGNTAENVGSALSGSPATTHSNHQHSPNSDVSPTLTSVLQELVTEKQEEQQHRGREVSPARRRGSGPTSLPPRASKLYRWQSEQSERRRVGGGDRAAISSLPRGRSGRRRQSGARSRVSRHRLRISSRSRKMEPLVSVIGFAGDQLMQALNGQQAFSTSIDTTRDAFYAMFESLMFDFLDTHYHRLVQGVLAQSQEDREQYCMCACTTSSDLASTSCGSERVRQQDGSDVITPYYIRDGEGEFLVVQSARHNIRQQLSDLRACSHE